MSDLGIHLGIDIHDERTLLAVHDFTALHERLDTSLRRRAVLLGATVVAIVTAVAVGAALHAARARDCPCDIAPAPRLAVTTVAFERPSPAHVALPRALTTLRPERVMIEPRPKPEPRAVTHPSAPPRPTHERTTPARVAVARAPEPVSATSALAEAAAISVPHAEPEDVVGGERSSLRAQLELYQDAQRASDPERAFALADSLRSRFPNGPFHVEAGLLSVRSLLDREMFDEAASALALQKSTAAAAGKSAAWRALAQRLPAPPIDDDPPNLNQELE